MAFASLDTDDDAPLAEINMIPLIDVMLVLLVIFMVTAPLLTHAVKVELPRASSAPNQTKADHIQLAVDAAGQVLWNGEPVDDPVLGERLAAAARQSPQPEVQLRADRSTPYARVAQTLSTTARAGLSRIGFVTDPSPPD
ncbi:MAG TPA: biopolymer transporter ExbD [Rhodocyclaceae bacterium]|jgi:biopolymer transport protein ExbD|nr:biopolymer transporter ExbD [Betaproteobacteria bacterium]HMU99537.1 biopolymer transporter ExbD [Rhodocyclaceae bacterium]HMV20131.1 biopolymer transporter ExbD [Rhodocyclaceae bacterium]HNE41673.1 biopolymer transporter ExbD [Rhodocyclaceae bacterium]HNM23591.1 biopolymer transporter ExbD [Rhodocyclaceae bacterium]